VNITRHVSAASPNEIMRIYLLSAYSIAHGPKREAAILAGAGPPGNTHPGARAAPDFEQERPTALRGGG